MLVCSASAAVTATAHGQQQVIDTQRSVMTVRVYKAGFLSALGHDHEISAPIASGFVNADARQVEVHVNAAALEVRDQDLSAKDRAQIQATMVGPEVLDARQYADIVFRSTTVEDLTSGSWKVRGNLTLHGQTHPILIEVRASAGHYAGTSRLKQTDFGIKPVKVGGGAVRVKDEVRVDFDIQPAR